MATAGYDSTRQKILETLLQRPTGTEIQPEGHQDFALALLDYIRSVELISGSTLIGIAEENTTPVQPEDANVAYIAGVAQERTATFTNFRGEDGDPLVVETGENEAKLVILFWNKEYWAKEEVNANIVSQADTANYFYNLAIRRTYSSTAAMNADVSAPTATDGTTIKYGEIVSVVNTSDSSQNAIYSYETDGTSPYWQYQSSLVALDSRVIDGGRADTQYGGTRTIDCGGAQG